MSGFKTVTSLRGLAIANILLLLYSIFASLTQNNDCFLYKLYFCDEQNKTYSINDWYPSELIGDNITGKVSQTFTLRFTLKGFVRLSSNKSFLSQLFIILSNNS
jgi:hypothetical protein